MKRETQKTSKGRKIGRDEKKCARYRAENIREKNKEKRARKLNKKYEKSRNRKKAKINEPDKSGQRPYRSYDR